LIIFSILSGWFYVQGFLLPYSLYCQQYDMMQMQANPMMAQQMPAPNFTELIVPSLFSTFSIILIFLVPLLTMRLISEEKREGTIELLYTYPVSDLQVILAKYAAALVIFLFTVLLCAIYLYVPELLKEGGGVVEWRPILSALLGYFLLGAASISLGLIFSAVTENQIVSAALTFALLLFLWVVGWAPQSGTVEGVMKTLAESVSLTDRSEDLFKGLIHLSDLVFFLCVIVGALFITMRSLESHRWRG
ncbi:MAG: ABC transporter permease, partial [Candidatus Omnitrophica bacterium]|nr:ABC transporter permease [Candidatus Omnitrophota bacterium]